MSRCKVCENETIRAQVDRMISEGVSDEGVSKSLASIGVSITKTSILRHRQNHMTSAPVEGVELDPTMVVARPAKIEPADPLGTEAAELLDQVRAQVDGGNVDLARDRMVRESIMARIYESQLAITSTALTRFQNGEGRYPLDMVKGLATVGTLFEKTAIHLASLQETKERILENEIRRLEQVVFEDAKTRTLNNGKVPTALPLEHQETETWFRYADKTCPKNQFNNRMEMAWLDGIDAGKREKRVNENGDQRGTSAVSGEGSETSHDLAA